VKRVDAAAAYSPQTPAPRPRQSAFRTCHELAGRSTPDPWRARCSRRACFASGRRKHRSRCGSRLLASGRFFSAKRYFSFSRKGRVSNAGWCFETRWNGRGSGGSGSKRWSWRACRLPGRTGLRVWGTGKAQVSGGGFKEKTKAFLLRRLKNRRTRPALAPCKLGAGCCRAGSHQVHPASGDHGSAPKTLPALRL